MSLPSPVQQVALRRWTWVLAGALVLLVAFLLRLGSGDGNSDASRPRYAPAPESIANRPADLRRLAEAVHLRYIESEAGHTPQEKLARAIHSAARSRHMSPEAAREALEKYAAMISSQSRSSDYEIGLAALIRGDFAGISAASREDPAAAGASAQPRDFLSSYLAAADSHLAAGRFDDAVRACEDARRFVNRERDPENWARVQAALFFVRFTQDQIDVAFTLANEVLEVRERVLAPDSPGIANALLNRAVCLSRYGRDAEAAPLLQRAIAIYEKAYGAGDAAVADAASELADVLAEIDRLPEAEKSARRAIAIYESAGDHQAARLALALDRLGAILLTLKRPAEAEPPLRRAVAIYDKLPNPRAKDHAGAQHRLGLAVAKAGRRGEALPHLRRSTVLARKFFAEDDPLLATYFHNLAVWADAAGDDPGTVEAYGDALRICGLHRSRTGRTVPQMDQTMTFYAEYLRRSGVSEPDILRRQREALGE